MPDASQLGFELKEARMQDLKNRQNGTPTDNLALQAGGKNVRIKY
jgi:hypothetical protein